MPARGERPSTNQAPDRVAAWDAWFASRTLPDNAGTCDTPLEKTLELGRKLHVNATPTLVFADGTVVPGALPAERLEREIARAQADLAAGNVGGSGNAKPAKDKAARSGG